MKIEIVEFGASALALFFRVLLRASAAFRFASIASVIRNAKWRARLHSMGRGAGIAASAVIKDPSCVSIGERSLLGDFVHVWGGGGVDIGDDVLVASHCVITSLTHDRDAALFRASLVKGRIVIEDNVWIGAGAIILPGVTLGRGSIVGAGAIVTRDVAAGDVVVGVPAKVVRSASLSA